MRRVLKVLGVVATAVSLPVISAPVNLHWLHWVAFVPLFWAIRDLSLKRSLVAAYAMGWLANLVIFWWLIETVQRFSSLPWAVALLVHLLATTAFSLSYALFGVMPWLRRRLSGWWMLAMPIVAVASEQAFPVLFPYYQGVSQYRVPLVFQLASVTGVMGVSFLIVLVNSVLAETLFSALQRRRPPVLALLVTAGLVVANLGFGAWRSGDVQRQLAHAPVLRVSLLQQDVTMEQRLTESPWESLFSWTSLTSRILDQHPDLVIWPEGAIAFNPNDDQRFSTLRTGTRKKLVTRLMQAGADRMLEFPPDMGILSPNNPQTLAAIGSLSLRRMFEQYAHSGGYDLLIGGGTIEDNPRAGEPGQRDYIGHNSLYVFDETGTIEGRYDKMVPLPFGEYIPLSDTFPFLKHIVQGPGDFQAGDHPVFFQVRTANGETVHYTTPICYEAILAPTMRRLAGGGAPDTTADMFVNITNDAWFGDTASPHQHAMLTAVQTIQLGRPMVRVAYTGISWVVEPDGTILHETAPFTEHAEVVDVRVLHVPTIYESGGWIFGWLCVAGAAVVVVIGRRQA